jgi:2'-5' RNA ligase
MTTPPPALPYQDADELADHWWWRPGWQVGTRFYMWYVTVANLPALADHVVGYQKALRPFGFLDLIPRDWLHITIQGIGHSYAVTDTQRNAVVTTVADQLAAIPAPALVFARPVLHREAVVLPPTDPRPLAVIRNTIRAGIEGTYGPAEGGPTADFRPHVSLAYVNAIAAAAPVRVALDTVQADPVEVTISHVSLIELHRDNRMYEWTTVADVPLGNPPT